MSGDGDKVERVSRQDLGLLLACFLKKQDLAAQIETFLDECGGVSFTKAEMESHFGDNFSMLLSYLNSTELSSGE